MKVSFLSIILAMAAIGHIDALSVLNSFKDRVVIKGQKGKHSLIYTVSIPEGVPLVQIAKEEGEGTSDAKIQLAISKVSETKGKVSLPFQGSKMFWESLKVDETNPQRIVVTGRMTRKEKDIAGNFYVYDLEAEVEDGSIKVNQYIQNFPYTTYGLANGADEGNRLVVEELLGSSAHIDQPEFEAGLIVMDKVGELTNLSKRAYEDGEPVDVTQVHVGPGDAGKMSFLKSSLTLSRVKMQFDANSPKNATIIQELRFDPEGAAKAQKNTDELESKKKSTAQKSDASSVLASAILGFSSLAVAAVAYLI